MDFIYERKTDEYVISKYKTNQQLVQKVQTGKGDETFMYPQDSYKNLYIQVIFAGTTPQKPYQDLVFGKNDLIAAKASRMFLELEP